MVFKAIGLMSGSSLDGLDLVFVHFLENAGQWTYEIKAAECYPYPDTWRKRLSEATTLSAEAYCLLHTAYGHYTGQQVNRFIEQHQLHLQMDLIASHGHTTFHRPDQQMTAQLGDGAAIAATTGVAVVSDLRNMDIALGGQGAPLVPIGEQWLFPDHHLFLNLGGIANIAFHQPDKVTAFDICPAGRVLNLLAETQGKPFDEDGALARSGSLCPELLEALNAQPYYQKLPPKSLANTFGTQELWKLIEQADCGTADKLYTYVEHIAQQTERAIGTLLADEHPLTSHFSLLVTGGGAFNTFLVDKLRQQLQPYNLDIVLPDEQTIAYKEALIMALLGVLRWRENNTTLPSVTGAARGSIGGALWMGQEGW